MNENVIKWLLKSGDVKIVLTKEQATDCDRYTTSDIGIDEKLLMENAGCAIADTVIASMTKFSSTKKPHVFLFAGPGNNGADTVVAARHLFAHKIRFSLYMVTDERRWNHALHDQLTILKNRTLTRQEQKKPNPLLRRST
jgi:NAD(P)H-hydrate repair Nnr-like enzyme with NAD(P)H-hydrate epimerase domain